MQHTVYLSLGSNLGDKKKNILDAIQRINELVGEVVRQSTLYVSEPWGFQSDHAFVNAVVCCNTSLTPHEVLAVTQQIEREMGRHHKSRRNASGQIEYHDRTIDIDILLYDDLTVDTPELSIPHPLMHKRDFVMVPLREILPELSKSDRNEKEKNIECK